MRRPASLVVVGQVLLNEPWGLAAAGGLAKLEKE